MENANVSTDFKSGLYWRKNLWNGAATVPAILSLENGFVTLRTAVEHVFTEPVQNISAKFTMWGTMILTTPKGKYDITGSGASISPSFTQEMNQELGDAKNTTGLLSRAGLIGVGAGAAFDAAGASALGGGAAALGFAKGVKAIKLWKPVFGK